MGRPPTNLCATCGQLFAGGKRCKGSLNRDGSDRPRARCNHYQEGKPCRLRHNGQPATEINFDPAKPQMFVLWENRERALVLSWKIDHNLKGSWVVQLLGLDRDGPIKKQFDSDTTSLAFCGEVQVKGPGQNDLWASFGYEDPDEYDQEGNLLNKPREIWIHTHQED